jgi:glutathione S-transferase
VSAARDPFRAATDAYAQRLWKQVESQARAPWFLGNRFSALDIYLSVMTRWRPRRGWFETETPKLFAIAHRVDARPELVEVWKRNWPTSPAATRWCLHLARRNARHSCAGWCSSSPTSTRPSPMPTIRRASSR